MTRRALFSRPTAFGPYGSKAAGREKSAPNVTKRPPLTPRVVRPKRLVLATCPFGFLAIAMRPCYSPGTILKDQNVVVKF